MNRINDLLSYTVNLISGVIQGNVIGPVMFLRHINDLIEVLACCNINVKLFGLTDDICLPVDKRGVLYVGKGAVILLGHNFILSVL